MTAADPARETPSPATPLTVQQVALRRGLVLIPDGAEDNTALAAALQAELMQLGHMLDADAFEAARRAPREWLIHFHDDALSYLRTRLGADRPFQPFYRNFPTQVMQAGHLDLFINAFLHYLSNGTWEPAQRLEARGIRFEHTDFALLRRGSEDDLLRRFTQLAAAGQSLTEDDKAFLTWCVDTYGPGALPLPASIPFKETLCLLAARGVSVPVSSPTDVLRIAVAMSGGDISLPGVPPPPKPPSEDQLDDHAKRGLLGTLRRRRLEPWLQAQFEARRAERQKFAFRKFSRSERRFLLGLLETTSLDLPEMQSRLGRWLRLGEILHVGEYADRYPRTAAAFAALRNQHTADQRIRTFPGAVDLAFREDFSRGLELLATQPGQLARSLDHLLRAHPDQTAATLDSFASVAGRISAKVLLELLAHFFDRHRPDVPRAVAMRGRRARMKALEPLPPLDASLVQRVKDTILAVLRRKLAALDPLGNVWIDPRLRALPLPTAMRSMNAAIKTYVRGTRVPYRAGAKVIRPFIHWHDENGQEDLDLSVGFYAADFAKLGHVSFTNLKEDRLNSCHSGDIRHRRGACAEYVDVDVDACRAAGVRYAVVHAFNYNGRPMHTIKDTVFGLMEREFPEANEIFVPKTIANCMPLANEGTSVVVCIVDLEEGEYVWADVESSRVLPTIENAADATGSLLRALVRPPKLSVHDLLSLHAEVRGTLVDDPHSANHAWRWDDLVTDYAAIAAYMSF